ncbi:MAG TPA: FG-GAP-like repeat-containing protein [Isosphaeraceae bacterium]|nr:FG-GAP-like repeat-containing protein [Isosphaeraceae bacterium]
MRLNRYWWTVGLCLALAWSGWCLRARWYQSGDGQQGREQNPTPARVLPAPPVAPEPVEAVTEPQELPGPDPGLTALPEYSASSPRPEDLPGLEDFSNRAPAPPASTDPSDSPLRPEDRPVVPGEPAEENPALAQAIRLGDLAQRAGRLAEAERHFLAAVEAPGPQSLEPRRRLAGVFWLEGRFDEVRTLAEEIWGAAIRAGETGEAEAMLQFHLALGLNPLPVVRIREALEQAVAQSPEDDRVWLGRANLAIRDGRLTEAESWLHACLRRRPDDPAVWRARLEWALVAHQVAEARAALRHLPSGAFPPGRISELRAWFAAHRGDTETARRALENAVGADPGNLAVLERLASLATEAGRAEEAARLRRRKADLDRALDRYRRLFREGHPTQNVAEMARLAETLGRRFEATGLWYVVLRRDPGDAESRAALDRLAHAESARETSSRSLADLLADELRRATPSGPAPPLRGRTPQFRDDAGAAGLTFTFENGESPRRQLPEVMSGGAGLLDYDGDGRLDVYVVQGGSFPPEPAGRPLGDRLIRNRGDGTFQDVSDVSGLGRLRGGYGHGIAVGDYDNDGHPDVFITRWRSYALYHNRGDGTFEDATASAGLGGDRDWPTSAAFADLDGDGDLDLYVCHYLAWNADQPEICRSPSSGRVIACDPHRFAARPDHLFRNDRGKFVDVTRAAGIVDEDGRGLGVVAADLDQDGKVDLFVANDGTANFLFRNRGELQFDEVGHESGVAAGASGGYQAGMGVACGDLDGDGRCDLAVTNFFGESTTLFQNLGRGLFTDGTAAAGLLAPSRHLLGFGIAFLDADNDGRLDLMTVNGHVADERPEIPYAMPAQLLRGCPGNRLTDITTEAGPPLQAPRIGRALAVGDLDNDGRVDAIVLGHDGPLAYFHNQGPTGHAITIRLEGTASNRDGVGARVTLEAGGRRQVAFRVGGGSYQSASDPRLHFGLGPATRVDALEVRWPSGRIDRYRALTADNGYLLREGDAQPRTLPGWGARK